MEKEPEAGMQIRLADKREAILQAAFELICQKGQQHTTITEIARASGVSVGTLYKYYPNKKAIIFAAYDRWNEKMFSQIFEVWQKLSTPFELREIIGSSLDIAVKHHLFPKRAHDEFWVMIYSDEEFKREYNHHMLRSVDIGVPHLTKLGFSVPNARERIHFVVNMVETYAHEVAYHETEGLEYERIKETLVEFVCNFLLK